MIQVLCYYGTKRNVGSECNELLKSSDVILTTYGTLQSEHKNYLAALNSEGSENKNKKINLFEKKWDRIVLDEAHTIKVTLITL